MICERGVSMWARPGANNEMSYDVEPETRRKRAHGSVEVKGRNVADKKASDET
jgi:hypothetical protein